MIPNTLHQVWLGPNPMPPQYLEWRNNWRRLHPGWKYVLWTEGDAPESVRLLMNACLSLSGASNVLRLHALHEDGGVYADLDVNWNRSTDHLLRERAFVARENPDSFCNAVMAAEAGHEMIAYQLEHLPEYVSREPPWGPKLLTRAMRERGEGVTILPTELVYPYLCASGYQPAGDFPDALMVHHWALSWVPGMKARAKKRRDDAAGQT